MTTNETPVVPADSSVLEVLLTLASQLGAHVEAVGSDEELVIYTGWRWDEEADSYRPLPEQEGM